MALKHILGTVPVIRILDFLLDHRNTDYTRAEIAMHTGLSRTTMKRDFHCLIDCSIVFETRRIGGVSLYALDVENEMTQSLIEFDTRLTEYCTKQIEDALDDTYGNPLPEPED